MLTKNQVFRILRTLHDCGYVRQLPDRSYDLGWKFFEIGQQVLKRNDLVQTAVSFMQELRDATGETVHLFARDGLEAVCIARRESTAAVTVISRVGGRFPMHAGASPKAILAFQEPSVVDAVVAVHGLPSFTERTISHRDRLDRELTMIREQGYAESEGEVEPFGYGVAVPIAGPDGTVNHALSIAGLGPRLSPEQRRRALTLLQDVQARISATLGLPIAGDRLEFEAAMEPAATGDERKPGASARAAG